MIARRSYAGIAMLSWTSVLVVLSVLWPRYGFYRLPGLPDANPFTAAAALSWLVLILVLVASPATRVELLHAAQKVRLTLVLLVAWIAMRLVASLLGETPTDSAKLLMNEVVYLGIFVPLGLLAGNNGRGRTWIVRALVTSTAVALGLAVLEAASGRSVVHLLNLRFTAGDSNELFSATAVQFRGNLGRIRSVFRHSIVFGQLLAFAAPLALSQLRSDRSLPGKAIALGVLAASPWAILMSGSRAALVCFAISISIYLAAIALRQRSRHGRAGAVLLVLFALIIGLASTPVLPATSRFIIGTTVEESGSSRVRLAMLTRGLEAFSERPLLGFGEGRSAHHAGFLTGNRILTVDSQFLSILVDSGFLGFSAYVAVWLSVLTLALRRAIGGDQSELAAALLGGLVALAVSLSVVSIPDQMQLAYLSLGLLAGIIPRKHLDLLRSPPRRLPPPSLAQQRRPMGYRVT